MNAQRSARARELLTQRFLVGCATGLVLICSSCKKTSPSNQERETNAQNQQQHGQAEEARAEVEENKRKAALEQKKAEEDAALAHRKAVDKMFACCEALAKAGFEQRSMTFMKGFELCDAAQKEGKQFAAVSESVKATLNDQKLPLECTTE